MAYAVYICGGIAAASKIEIRYRTCPRCTRRARTGSKLPGSTGKRRWRFWFQDWYGWAGCCLTCGYEEVYE